MNTPTAPVGLSPDNLTLPKEKTYYGWVIAISLAAWLVIAISIVGIFYAAFISFFLWLGSGMLIAHLKSEAVRVDQTQLPQLHATFREVCAQLGVATPPDLYVLQAGGMLNAFATRFVGRDFVVVYSDFLEALGPDTPEMRFILGHELGHVKSRHILKQIVLGPGLFFPLIGPAYRRAWESSCDRHGAYAAQDVDGSVRAMLTISGGRENGRNLNAESFSSQYSRDRGFFVSLHELTSTYPTLSRRVTDLLALKTGQTARRAERNPLAYLVALGMPGGNISGGGSPVSAMVMVVIIGLLAAMAIPAFQKVRQNSQQKMCLNNLRMMSAAFDQTRLETGQAPTHISELAGPGKLLPNAPYCPLGGVYTIPDNAPSGDHIYCSTHGSIQDLMHAFQDPRR